jgi:hypothetical protein
MMLLINHLGCYVFQTPFLLSKILSKIAHWQITDRSKA